MQRFQRTLPHAAAALCLVTCCSLPVQARQTILSGAIGTGIDIRDRSYDQGNRGGSSDDQQKLSLTPSFTLNSAGLYDQLSFRYAPSLNYDFVDDESSLDHSLGLTYQRMLSSRWTVNIADNFTLSDDPDAASSSYSTDSGTDSTGTSDTSSTEDTLSRDQFGSTYWTNTASLRTSYALFERTTLGGGYTYSVLRNDSSGTGSDDSYDEYDKHTFSANISHGFNAYWRGSLGGNYTRGLYKEPPPSALAPSTNSDLNQYGLNLGLDYVQSVRNFFPFQYSYSQTQYDNDTRSDTQSQQWSLGWNHSFDPQTTLAIGGGPSYAKTEGQDGAWGYNAYLDFTKQYQHATWKVQLSKQYETNNFTGTDESGLTDTYSAKTSFAYQYTKNLGLDIYGRYSKESQIDPQGKYRDAVTGLVTQTQTGDNTYDKDIYEIGAGLSYTFARWYSLGLKYSYYVSEGQTESDQYDEHRIMLSLSASKEFWRW